MKSADALLEEAKWSHLSNDELKNVANRIQKCQPGDDKDLYTLLWVLGLAEAKMHRPLVERFLEYPSDPSISMMALKVLTCYWDEPERYIDAIWTFIKGAKWDRNNDIRDIAVTAAGIYLHSHEDAALLTHILEIFKDTREIAPCRENAYSALAYAMTGDWEYIDMNSLSGLDLELIQKTHEYLGLPFDPNSIQSSYEAPLELEPHDLLYKAEYGQLSDAEIQMVAENIRNGESDLYMALQTLREAKAYQYRNLIETFLYYQKEPEIADLALSTLTLNWNLASEYLKVIESFLLGVDWDQDEDLRFTAIAAAENYLEHHFDQNLFTALVSLLEREETSDFIRECTAEALAKVTGGEADDIPQLIRQARKKIS